MKDFVELAKLTLVIYKKTVVLSFIQTIKNWQTILLQLALVIIILLSIVILFPNNLIFSLIKGLIFTFVLALYLNSIRNIVLKERNNLKYIAQEALPVFSNLLSIFFALTIINFILRAFNNQLISSVFAILFSVLANPLLEISYLRGGSVSELVTTSFEFVRDNFFEWFIPTFILISATIGLSYKSIFIIFSQNPLSMIEILLIGLTSMLMNWQILIPLLYILLFVNLFRANLFIALEKGRRSRLYLSRQ